jgi:hypothetical protein
MHVMTFDLRFSRRSFSSRPFNCCTASFLPEIHVRCHEEQACVTICRINTASLVFKKVPVFLGWRRAPSSTPLLSPLPCIALSAQFESRPNLPSSNVFSSELSVHPQSKEAAPTSNIYRSKDRKACVAQEWCRYCAVFVQRKRLALQHRACTELLRHLVSLQYKLYITSCSLQTLQRLMQCWHYQMHSLSVCWCCLLTAIYHGTDTIRAVV